MKILALGDPHGSEKIFDIPLDGIDYVLIAGDIGKADLLRKYFFQYNIKEKVDWKLKVTKEQMAEAYSETIETTEKVLSYFDSKGVKTFWVYGNVEKGTDEDIIDNGLNIKKLSDLEFDNVQLINYGKIDLDGVSLVGIPYFREVEWLKDFQPENQEEIKQAEQKDKEVKSKLDSIGNADIVLTHNPPYGVLDKVTNPNAPEKWHGKLAGSHIMKDYIEKTKPKVVICGHIHEQKGIENIGNTKVVNTGEAGESYIIEINKDIIISEGN